MFESYVFGSCTSQTKYDEDISASPTDTSFSPIEPSPDSISPFSSWEISPFQGGINDIVNQFSNQSLSPDCEEPQRSVWQHSQLASPDFEDEDPFTEEELTYVSTTRGMARVHHTTQSMPNTPMMAPSHNSAVACRRLQRQLNVQLQSCSNHMKDINALVEDMITTNSQCKLHKSASRPYLQSPPPRQHASDDLVAESTEIETRIHEDEGFGDFEDAATMMKEEVSLRRASTPIGIRKYGGLRYRASAESVGASLNGKTKVRCVPRMRKRKVISVPG
ncbi:hypothetical protein LSUE1_G007312 [Lachnellula suecica]|uniref:Uncharacterized protein n=1 Tax=Lachnellula suecica TaxID=602035 RepID=A0A8T9C626_9HELO|nr:hypothetical protein LSUE1_G007312 [Lachnellula suecica]